MLSFIPIKRCPRIFQERRCFDELYVLVDNSAVLDQKSNPKSPADAQDSKESNAHQNFSETWERARDTRLTMFVKHKNRKFRKS